MTDWNELMNIVSIWAKMCFIVRCWCDDSGNSIHYLSVTEALHSTENIYEWTVNNSLYHWNLNTRSGERTQSSGVTGGSDYHYNKASATVCR